MDRIHFTASPSSFPRPCISISRGPVTLHGIGRSRTRPIPLQGHRRDYSTTNEVRKQQIHLQRLYDAVVSLVYEVQLEEDAFEEILHLMDIAQDSLILLAADERTMDYGLLSLGRPSHPLYSLPHTMRFTLPFPPSSTVPSSPLPITPADDILSSTTETSATPPPTNLTVVSWHLLLLFCIQEPLPQLPFTPLLLLSLQLHRYRLPRMDSSSWPGGSSCCSFSQSTSSQMYTR